MNDYFHDGSIILFIIYKVMNLGSYFNWTSFYWYILVYMHIFDFINGIYLILKNTNFVVVYHIWYTSRLRKFLCVPYIVHIVINELIKLAVHIQNLHRILPILKDSSKIPHANSVTEVDFVIFVLYVLNGASSFPRGFFPAGPFPRRFFLRRFFPRRHGFF